jgi:hypothetical protein
MYFLFANSINKFQISIYNIPVFEVNVPHSESKIIFVNMPSSNDLYSSLKKMRFF